MSAKKKADPDADDYPKIPAARPVTNTDRRWFERRIGQQRLPGFEDATQPPRERKSR